MLFNNHIIMSKSYKTIKGKFMKEKECLLLKTPDERIFCTNPDNLPLLVEFGRTFNAEISLVKLLEPTPILDLEEMAKAICEKEKTEIPKYELIKIQITPSETSKIRLETLKKNRKIKDWIKEKMFSNKLSVNDIETEFKISKQSAHGYMTRAKREIEASGHKVNKEGAGIYSATKIEEEEIIQV